MRLLTRRSAVLAGVALLAALLLAVASVPRSALATIIFAGSGQESFGVDADGNRVDGQGTEEFTDALDKFRQTEEGQRIERELDGADVEVTIEVLPDAEVGEGRAWGTAQVTERDPETGKPTKVVVKIARDDTGGVDNLADTLQHELRHVEIFIDDNDPAKHDALDDEHDELNLEFREQVRQVRLPEPTATPTLEPPSTPNYDRIMEDARKEEALAEQARLLGDILGDLVDSIESHEPEPDFDEAVVDLKYYGGLSLEFTLEDVAVDFNESVFECGSAAGERRVVCPAGVQPMPAGRVIVIAMVLEADVPAADAEHSFIYSTVFDSDGDPANDWVPQGPYNWDYFQGADRWYQLAWDHRSGRWDLGVTQVSAGGGAAAVGASTARAVMDADTIVFFISAEEFPAERPAFRVSAFGHDGAFGQATRAGDVSGEDPTEPPIPVTVR